MNKFQYLLDIFDCGYKDGTKNKNQNPFLLNTEESNQYEAGFLEGKAEIDPSKFYDDMLGIYEHDEFY